MCSLKTLKSINCYKINILSNSYPSFKTTRNSHVCEVCACVYICVCTPMCLFVEAGGCMFVCAHLCAYLWRLVVDRLPSSPLSVLVLEFLLWIWNLLFQLGWHFIHWAVSLAPRLVFGCAFDCSSNHVTEACVNCTVMELSCEMEANYLISARDWRGGLVSKSTGWSSGDWGFSSQP